MLLFCRDGVDALQEAVGVLHDLVLTVGSVEHLLYFMIENVKLLALTVYLLKKMQ